MVISFNSSLLPDLILSIVSDPGLLVLRCLDGRGDEGIMFTEGIQSDLISVAMLKGARAGDRCLDGRGEEGIMFTEGIQSDLSSASMLKGARAGDILRLSSGSTYFDSSGVWWVLRASVASLSFSALDVVGDSFALGAGLQGLKHTK